METKFFCIAFLLLPFLGVAQDNSGQEVMSKKEKKELNLNDLKNNRLIFIHTDLTHNEVISTRNQLQDYLKTSKMPSIGF